MPAVKSPMKDKRMFKESRTYAAHKSKKLFLEEREKKRQQARIAKAKQQFIVGTVIKPRYHKGSKGTTGMAVAHGARVAAYRVKLGAFYAKRGAKVAAAIVTGKKVYRRKKVKAS